MLIAELRDRDTGVVRRRASELMGAQQQQQTVQQQQRFGVAVVAILVGGGGGLEAELLPFPAKVGLLRILLSVLARRSASESFRMPSGRLLRSSSESSSRDLGSGSGSGSVLGLFFGPLGRPRFFTSPPAVRVPYQYRPSWHATP
jgi:hypothetical protein